MFLRKFFDNEKSFERLYRQGFEEQGAVYQSIFITIVQQAPGVGDGFVLHLGRWMEEGVEHYLSILSQVFARHDKWYFKNLEIRGVVAVLRFYSVL